MAKVIIYLKQTNLAQILMQMDVWNQKVASLVWEVGVRVGNGTVIMSTFRKRQPHLPKTTKLFNEHSRNQ